MTISLDPIGVMGFWRGILCSHDVWLTHRLETSHDFPYNQRQMRYFIIVQPSMVNHIYFQYQVPHDLSSCLYMSLTATAPRQGSRTRGPSSGASANVAASRDPGCSVSCRGCSGLGLVKDHVLWKITHSSGSVWRKYDQHRNFWDGCEVHGRTLPVWKIHDWCLQWVCHCRILATLR